MTPVSMGALVLIVMGTLPVSVYHHMVATSVRMVSALCSHGVDIDSVGPPSDDRQHSPDTPACPLLFFPRLRAMRARLGQVSGFLLPTLQPASELGGC